MCHGAPKEIHAEQWTWCCFNCYYDCQEDGQTQGTPGNAEETAEFSLRDKSAVTFPDFFLALSYFKQNLKVNIWVRDVREKSDSYLLYRHSPPIFLLQKLTRKFVCLQMYSLLLYILSYRAKRRRAHRFQILFLNKSQNSSSISFWNSNYRCAEL